MSSLVGGDRLVLSTWCHGDRLKLVGQDVLDANDQNDPSRFVAVFGLVGENPGSWGCRSRGWHGGLPVREDRIALKVPESVLGLAGRGVGDVVAAFLDGGLSVSWNRLYTRLEAFSGPFLEGRRQTGEQPLGARRRASFLAQAAGEDVFC